MLLAAPLKVAGVGDPVVTVGLVPFVATLLTTKDGQGVVDTGGAERVIILSAGAEGHDVPQGAEMVVVADCEEVRVRPMHPLRDILAQNQATYLGMGADSHKSESCEEELHDVDGYEMVRVME